MKKICVALELVVLGCLSVGCSGESQSITKVEVYWSETCTACHEAMPYIKSTLQDYNVEYIEMSEGSIEDVLFKVSRFRSHNLEVVPSIVIYRGISKSILQGKYEIEGGLKSELEKV